MFGLVALTFLTVAPAMAKDKDHIELTCGTTKATITCTKFKDIDDKEGVCVESQIEFSLKNGKRLTPKNYNDIPQVFKIPTIADSLTCRATEDSLSFSVSYTADCNFSECIHINTFSTDGKQLSFNGKPIKDFPFHGPPSFSPIPPITLREQNQ